MVFRFKLVATIICNNACMESFIVARVLHVLGVVLWIGGVGMVTLVLLPAVRQMASPQDRLAFFDRIERRFAHQARGYTLLTGLSGFYMLYRIDGWERYTQPQFWWLHAMTLTWAIFTLMLFVLEPLVLHRRLERAARVAPERTFALVTRLHWVLLALSLITVAGAVAGSHGWRF